MSQVQYDFRFGDLAFLVKRHSCPKCFFKRLKVGYRAGGIIEQNKTNAYEFKIGKYVFSGNKTIKEPFFYCKNCKSKFTLEEIKSYEIRSK